LIIAHQSEILSGNQVSGRFLSNVLLKGLLLFAVFDLIFVGINPEGLGKVSLYNHFFPGRQRFPFGEDPAQSYNLSLFNLDSMFASHIIAARPKKQDEYRIIIIGDSSIWGTLLRPEDTLAGQLDLAGIKICRKTVRVFNLGYPTISLTKDLMLLDYAMKYSPDLVIWPLTLEAFPFDKQLTSPLVANNADRVDALGMRYNLPYNPKDPNLFRPGFWDRTLIGQRRGIADLVRLQMYGILWSATGVDQVYPKDYMHAQNDFGDNPVFHGMPPPILNPSQLAFGVLDAGLKMAGKIPVLIVNEPIMIGSGKNSNIHYNFFYPRWAYDQWRQMMVERAAIQGWNYIDLWDIIPAADFTNSAIHITKDGEGLLAEQIQRTLLERTCQ
jgi:hypothetical protein